MQNMFHFQLGLPLLWLNHHGKLHGGSSQNGISNLATPSKSPIFFDLVESDNVVFVEWSSMDCFRFNWIQLAKSLYNYIKLNELHYIKLKHVSKPR